MIEESQIHIHIVQHEVFEAPGAIIHWAQKHTHNISFSNVYEFDSLPTTVEHIDLLIIMGGPQSPHTTKLESPHFDAQAEMALIKNCIDAGKAVLGVCLGAQLIGQALGGTVEHSPEKEIGVFTIQLTPEGSADDKIAHFGDSLATGHWHSDMPGLTKGSKILATSMGCPRQIVAYSHLVYGFQCHMEFTAELVEMLIAEEEKSLTESIHQFVQKPEVIRRHDYTQMNQKLFVFLDKLVEEYRSARNHAS